LQSTVSSSVRHLFLFVSWVLLAEKGWINFVLSTKPIVYLGRISYGVYLFQPMILLTLLKLFHMSSADPDLHKLFPLDATATFALAALSFRFYETPILNWGHDLSKRLESVRETLPDSSGATTPNQMKTNW